MKLHHKIPSIALQRKPEPISARYAAEIERSLKRAEKAWRQAERRAQKAQQRQLRQPSPAGGRELELILAEADRLRIRFEEIDRLMKQAPVSSAHGGSGQIRHRAGRDDHLEAGIHKRARR